MRRLLSLFPISRREADQAADVIESMSWSEFLTGMLVIGILMILTPTLLLILQAPAGWS